MQQEERTQDVEEPGGVRETLAEALRARQVLEQCLRRVPAGLGQHRGVQLAQSQLVPGAIRRLRQLTEQAEGWLQTRDGVPVGEPVVRSVRGLLEVRDRAPSVAAALDMHRS